MNKNIFSISTKNKFFYLPFILILVLLSTWFWQGYLSFWSQASAAATINLTTCGTLNQVGVNYVLMNDVNSEGTCFSITASNITLDLNSKIVTYDNFSGSGLSNPGFELGNGNVPSGWDVSQASSVQRKSTSDFPMVDEWYLEFVSPSAGEEIISSWTNLPPNTQAQAYFVNGSAGWRFSTLPSVTLWVEFEDGSIVYSKSFSDLYQNQNHQFTTLSSAGQYRLHFRVDSPPSISNDGHYITIDQLDLRTYDNRGVYISGANAIVKNGTVTQGSGQGSFNHAVEITGSGSGTVIDNLNINTAGVIAEAIYGNYTNNLEIKNSTIVSTNPTIFRRNDLENVISLGNSGSGNYIHDNTITSGNGFGCITIARGSDHTVSNNVCNTNSSITNHHGIIIYNASNTVVSSNTINATNGQGILFSTGIAGGRVEYNTINLNGIAPNVEYGLISFDAIRLNNYGNTETGTFRVTGNTINISGGMDSFFNTGFAGANPNSKVINGLMNNANLNDLLVSDNIFNINVSDPNTIGSCWEIGDATVSDGAVFENNTCASNSKNVVIGGYAAAASNVLQRSNTFTKISPAVGDYHTLFSRRTNAKINNVRFLDTTLTGGASFDTSYIYTYAPPSQYDFTVEWYLNLIIQDTSGQLLNGANVELRDSTGQIVFSGNSDSQGKINNIDLVQYQRYGSNFNSGANNKTQYTPHTLTVSASGYDVAVANLTMDSSQTYTVQLGASGSGSCTTNWSCSTWSACDGTSQTRTCTDSNSCGTITNRPALSQSCTLGGTPPNNTSGVLLHSTMDNDDAINNPNIVTETGTAIYETGSGNVSYETGKYGTAARLDQFSPNVDRIVFGANNFDLSDVDNDGGRIDFWMKLNQDPHNNMPNSFIARTDGIISGPPYWWYTMEFIPSGYPYFEMMTTENNSQTGGRLVVSPNNWSVWENILAGEWHLYTITWRRNSGNDQAELHLYIDGTNEGCSGCSDYNGNLPPIGSSSELIFGSNTSGTALDYSIDELWSFSTWNFDTGNEAVTYASSLLSDSSTPNPPSCTPNWSCSTWSACSASTQARTCTDSNSCGTTTNRPALSQSCTTNTGSPGSSGGGGGGGAGTGSNTPSCSSAWSCTAWLDCDNGVKTRTCSDVNTCTIGTNRPAVSVSCSLTSSNLVDEYGDVVPSEPSSSSPGFYQAGNLLRTAGSSTLYYIGTDYKKYIFPDATTYYSWFHTFDDVKIVPIAELDKYEDGGVISYRPGTYLITTTDTAKIYAVSGQGYLYWIKDEETAARLYGSDWTHRVRDVIPGFFATTYRNTREILDEYLSGTIFNYNDTYYYLNRNSGLTKITDSGLSINHLRIDTAINLNSLAGYEIDTNLIDQKEARYFYIR